MYGVGVLLQNFMLTNISIQLILTSVKLLSIIIIHLLNVMMIIFFFCLVLFELDNVMDWNGIIQYFDSIDIN